MIFQFQYMLHKCISLRKLFLSKEDITEMAIQVTQMYILTKSVDARELRLALPKSRNSGAMVW